MHQLRRWELMFGLEIKRGRGQQRQYRAEDMAVLERIKDLVDQGWPTSQIRPQLEAEGLVTPKLIGLPSSPGNPEIMMEAVIGLRNFTERRFIEMSKQIDDLRQLLITLSLKQELQGESTSPWQHLALGAENQAESAEEIAIGPAMVAPTAIKAKSLEPTSHAAPAPDERLSLGEVTDQNFLTVLGRALDLLGWSDEQADNYSQRTFSIAHWDELGRSQAEELIDYLLIQLHKAAHSEETASFGL